jgi:hypothetical protein
VLLTAIRKEGKRSPAWWDYWDDPTAGVELGDVDAGGLAANDVRDRWADPIDPYDLGPLSDDTSGGRV